MNDIESPVKPPATMSAANDKSEPQISEFLTSSQAAKRLGLSMATIQKLVDNNVLQAWKTFGGHRRISLASVLAYQTTNTTSQQASAPSNRPYQISMVIESPELIKRLSKESAQWQLPLKISFFESLTEALLELLNQKHDLLIMQMTTPRKQQEKILEILQKFMGSRHTLAHTLIVTPETDLLPMGKVGEHSGGIQVVNNDLSPLWLSAYLAGFVAQRRS